MKHALKASRSIGAGLTLALLTVSASGAVAQGLARSPDAMVQALPAEIPEVISGGGWQDGGLAGIYRGIIVMTQGTSGPEARVYVQWIGFKAEGGAPQIVKTVAIKEIADRRLANAQLALEADSDNEALLVVSTFDPVSQKPNAFAFKATKPGQVQPTALPASPAGPAPKQ